MRKQQIAAVLISILLSGNISAQNGTRLIGYDALTAGRGGVSTGFFDNPSLSMNNPAGLSFVQSSQIDLGISVMAPTVYFKNDINNTTGKKNLFPLGCLSYVSKPTGKLTYGIGIFTQGGMGADFELNHALYKDQAGNYIKQPYHSKFAVMQGGGSLAYKITDQLSAGITANLVYSQLEFQMPMSMPTAMMRGVIDPQTGYTFGNMFSDAPENGGLGYSEVVASANMKDLTAFGFNGKIGLAYKPNKKFSAGINYSLPVNLKYKGGSTEMDMNYQLSNAFGKVVAGIMQQNPGTTPEQAQQMAMNMFSQMGIDLSKGAADNYATQSAFSLPQSIAAGFSFSPSDKFRIGLDAEWINWKNAFDKMDIKLEESTNPNINRMLGSDGSFGMAFPMYWKNTVVIRTGLEYDASKMITVRGGYAYGSNPVPATTVFPVFPAIVKHHVTAGGTANISKLFAINLAFEHAFKSNQTAVADSYIGNEYNNSNSGLKNSIFHLSLSWKMK